MMVVLEYDHHMISLYDLIMIWTIAAVLTGQTFKPYGTKMTDMINIYLLSLGILQYQAMPKHEIFTTEKSIELIQTQEQHVT